MLTLVDSELRYRRLFEAAQDGILILDAKTGMIEDVNPYLVKMLGYSRKEIEQKKLWEVGAFKDIKASKDAFEALQENEFIRFDDLPLKTKDGKLIQVEFVSNVYMVDGERVIQCNIRDITIYRKVIAELQKNEKKYYDLVNQSPDGIFIIGLSGEILTVNKAMCNELNYTEEELLSKKILDIVPEQYLDHYRERLNKILKGESLGEEAEYEVRGKDGELHYVEVLSAPYFNGTNIIGFQGIARDITRRKQAEMKLRYQADLLKNVNDAIIATDSDNRITLWNIAAESLYGWEAEEVLGRNLEEIIPTKWPEDEGEGMMRAVAETNQWRGEATQLRKNGTWFAVEVSLLVLCDEKGQNEAYVTVNRDITERIRSEEALKLANSQLTNLYNNLPEAVFSIDIVENKMLQASPAHEVIFGYSPEEFLKNSQLWYEIIIPEDKPIIDGVYASLSKGGIRKQQYRILRPDGKTRWIESIIKPVLTADGTIVRIDGIASDISERKETEYRVRRQLDHLTALSSIDRVIASNFDLKISLLEILTHVTKELEIDAADILVLNPNSQILEYGAERGFRTTSIRKTNVKVGVSFVGRMALDREYVYIPNLGEIKDTDLFETIVKENDFVCYYGVPLIAKGQIKGVLEIFHRASIDPDEEWIDFLKSLSGQAAIAIENASLFESLQRSNLELSLAYDATIEGWSRALDLRDKETEGHTQRVSEWTVKLARAFGLSEAELVQVRWGGLLHDIGKMGIPDGILLKPGPLTEEEWVQMKKHPTFAYEMLSPILYLRKALDIPYYHHEKWDGSGYPNGLNGTHIPLAARIFAVVDVWDALTSDRPYRAAWTAEKTLEHIRSLSGIQFDPQVVEVFLQNPLN